MHAPCALRRLLLALSPAASFLVLALAVVLAPAPARAQGFGARARDPLAGPGPVAPIRYVTTISGGISLGAYEAGLNWALVRYLKKHRTPGPTDAQGALAPLELVAATGASAGNVNAFVTAVSWCQKREFDDRETPADNLFWRAWIPVGLEELFPGPKRKDAYDPDDGLFTRRAFQGIKNELAAVTAQAGRFDPECVLPIGVTVTRNRLGSIELGEGRSGAGPGLQIATQRFVVTFDARGAAGGLEFHERLRACDDPAVGQYLHLPGQAGKALDVGAVLDLVEASSAFPLAFGPKRILHCFAGGPPDPRCPAADAGAGAGETAGAESFFDGGVFDNVPLGLGVSLALPRKPEACPVRRNEGDIEFLYIDPGRRRRGPTGAAGLAPAADAGVRRGLASALEFLGNFVAVSRQYELQTAARYVFDRLFNENLRRVTRDLGAARAMRDFVEHRASAATSSARLRLSSRFYPLVGEYLGAFGAFFARSFREYDFYVGLYDALFGVAEAACQQRHAEGGAVAPAEEARCIAAGIADLQRELGVTPARAPGASFVVAALLRRELAAWPGDAGARLLASMPMAATAAPAGEIKILGALIAAHADLEAEESAARAQGDQALQEFERRKTLIHFVDRFRRNAGDLDEPGVRERLTEAERRFIEDPDAELRARLAEAAERQAEIEDEEGYLLGKRVLAATQLVLHSEPFRPSKGWDLDPSSVPDRRLTWGRALVRLLPYQVSGDFINGGTSVEYRPGYWFSQRLGVGVPLSPLVWQPKESRILAAGGVALLVHLDNVFLPELQLGPRVTTRWWPSPPSLAAANFRPGAELAAYLVAGKLRLSFGIDDFAAADKLHSWSVKLGLADLPGLTYWALRFLGG